MSNKTYLPNDIHILGFLKSIDNGHTFVQLSFDIPRQKQSTSVVVPMSKVNGAEILDYIPEGYVIKPSSKREQISYMRTTIFEAQKDEGTRRRLHEHWTIIRFLMASMIPSSRSFSRLTRLFLLLFAPYSR